MAATNIFPGDLLLKNFGVTRHGRVIFYDYDEVLLLGECEFRELPTPRTEEEETAAEPWFHCRSARCVSRAMAAVPIDTPGARRRLQATAWLPVDGSMVAGSGRARTGGGSSLYITGVTKRASSVEEMRPPMMTMASGEYSPEP